MKYIPDNIGIGIDREKKESYLRFEFKGSIIIDVFLYTEVYLAII